MSKYILGLTGGIATGKSTASDYLRGLNITVVDADLIARKVVAVGSPALAQIAAHFGKNILLENGALNRAKLREKIFSSTIHKDWLNGLLHPLIRDEILSQLTSASSSYAVLDAPLLLENGLDKYCHAVMLIDIDTELQIARACQRDGVTQEQIKAIIKSQMPREEKKLKANYIIDNSGSVDETHKQLQKVHQHLLTQTHGAC